MTEVGKEKLIEIWDSFNKALDKLDSKQLTGEQHTYCLLKFNRLLAEYNERLWWAEPNEDAIKEIVVCFHCFDKGGECHNCD